MTRSNLPDRLLQNNYISIHIRKESDKTGVKMNSENRDQ
jgi:hypothetical protein